MISWLTTFKVHSRVTHFLNGTKHIFHLINRKGVTIRQTEKTYQSRIQRKYIYIRFSDLMIKYSSSCPLQSYFFMIGEKVLESIG